MVDIDNRFVNTGAAAYNPSMPLSSGAELAMLLLGSFHSMVDEVTVQLEERGHKGVRPVHEFALQAINAGAETASELGRRLSVSKQAAAKTIAVLEQLGYVDREVDAIDARRKPLRVTSRGHELMTVGRMLFNDVRDRWEAQIGTTQLEALEAHLVELTKHRHLRADDVVRFDEDARTQ